MIYQVNITTSAFKDADNAYQWFRSSNEQFANEWFNGLIEAIDTLQQLPSRCALAPESKEFDREIRQLLYKKSKTACYRIIFGIVGSNVIIYRIRHTSQQYLSKEGFDL
jgi:plasmid stabilization system protein ParE